MPELSIIVPTKDRPDRVAELVRRLHACSDEAEFELLVVDASAGRDTERRLQAAGQSLGRSIHHIHKPGLDSPAARNLALESARAAVCLFLNDDCWPLPGLLKGHVAFHREHRETTAAMIGRAVPYWPYQPTPFERWLESSGFRHRYDDIHDPEDAGWRHFLTFNASAKLALLRAVGGFDERFSVGFEDNELGFRLEGAGMRLRYDPDAVVEHFHPASLATTLSQFRLYGRGRRLLAESRAEEPRPRRPGARHRLAAACLAVPYALGVRTGRVRAASWRLLCVEAFREGYWNGPPPSDSGVRVGGRLAKLASRDRAARFPVAATPAP